MTVYENRRLSILYTRRRFCVCTCGTRRTFWPNLSLWRAVMRRGRIVCFGFFFVYKNRVSSIIFFWGMMQISFRVIERLSVRVFVSVCPWVCIRTDPFVFLWENGKKKVRNQASLKNMVAEFTSRGCPCASDKKKQNKQNNVLVCFESAIQKADL